MQGVALPMLRDAASPRLRVTDLARGARGWLLWVPPISLLAVASILGSTGRIAPASEGLLLVAGTAIFGGLCLANAARCGRVHCWVDGTALPALAAAGALRLAGVGGIGWSAYLSVLWGIVVLGFLAECVVGPYARRSAP